MGKSLLAICYLTFVRSQELSDYDKQARKCGIVSSSGYPGARVSLPPRKEAPIQPLFVFAARENSLIIHHSQSLHTLWRACKSSYDFQQLFGVHQTKRYHNSIEKEKDDSYENFITLKA